MNTQAYSTQVLATTAATLLNELPGWKDVRVMSQPGDTDGEQRLTAQVSGIERVFRLSSKPAPPDGTDALPHILVGAEFKPSLRQSLRKQGWNYLDTAGNLFLDLPGLHVFRETGNTPLLSEERKRPAGETFNPTTTRVGLQLLLAPDLIEAPLRRIAQLSGISLRSAKLALDAFKADGLIEETGRRGLSWTDRPRFFQRWTDGYQRRLLPKLELGRFRPVTPLPHGLPETETGISCWGGDQAARLLTQSIQAEESILYVYDKIGPVLARNRLRLDPDGPIVLRKAVWSESQESVPGIAPLFVVHADLISSRDPRSLETAERLFQTSILELLA